MRLVLDSLPVALVTTNIDRRIVNANRSALNLFGYAWEELEGQEIEILIPSRFSGRHPEMYQSFVESPSTRPIGAGRDLAAVKKDGAEFPVEVGITILPTVPVTFLASVIDLTFRKRTELLLRERQELLETSLQEARRTLEEEVAEKTRLEERQRLGRELHDSLSQNLYGIGLGLRTSLAKLSKESDPTEALEYCLTLTEASLVEMRALLFRLRPKSLENVPLSDVLSSHAQAVSSRTKVPITFEQRGTPKAGLGFSIKYALYRIATEALHNSMKHARASQVRVVLTHDFHTVSVEVHDNGRGFQLDTVSAGHGMATMKERAASVGGTLRIESGESGTLVAAEVPWVAEEL
jgi:PAS domain S-box-containing protein